MPKQKLSPEVIMLQELLATSQETSPDLWASVTTAINATEASTKASIVSKEHPPSYIVSKEQTIATHMELCCNG